MLPSKLQAGQNFKKATVSTVNNIIDYLKTQRISGDNKTIKVNQQTAGLTIQALPQTNSPRGGGKSEFDYPFKMSIISGSYLSIQKGRVQINDFTQNRSYALFYDNNAIPLTNLSTDNTYRAILVIQYDSTASSADNNDNTYFPCNVVFTPSGLQTTDFPCCQGIFSMPIGYIKKETVQGDPVFTVEQQQIIGDFNFDFQTCRYPFSITAKLNSIQDGQVKTSFSTNDFSIHVNEGAILYDKMYVGVGGDLDHTLADATTYIYAVLDQQSKTATLSATNNFQYFYDQQNKKCRYEIGRIYCSNGDIQIYQTAVGLQGGDGADTYKVLSIENEDTHPDYLSSKFVWQTSNKLNEYNNTLIGSDTVKVNYSNPSSTSILLKPTWLWKDISGYQNSKYQFLTNNKSNLKWSSLSTMILLSGSLSQFVQNEYDQETSRNTLKWSDEFIGISSSIKLLGEDLSGRLTTYTWPLSNNIKDSVFLWDHSEPGRIHITTPPVATQQVSSYVLAGSTTGLSWKPYPSGEFFKVKVTDNDTQPNYLYYKLDSLASSLLIDDETNYVNLDINPEYFFSDNESIIIEQDLLGLNFEIDPSYFYSSDGTVAIQETEDGLDFTLSSAVVSVEEGDPPEYLNDKIDSLNQSIDLTLLYDGIYEFINMEVNPDYFNSSDDSIILEETSAYIDFRSTGKVACVSGDVLGYLNQKINIDSSIENLIALEKQNSQILIKSALSGNGLLLVNNGNISTVEIPTDGNYVLTNTSGTLGWVPYTDCDFACAGQQQQQ